MSAEHDLKMKEYRQLVGRVASHVGPSRETLDWAASLERTLLLVPVHRSDKLAELLAMAHRRSDRAVVFVTATAAEDSVKLHTLAVEPEHSHLAGTGCDLPVTEETSIGDFLSMLTSGVSMTLRIAGDELHAHTGSREVESGNIAADLLNA